MSTVTEVIPVMKPWLGEDEVAAAAEAIASGWVAQGPRVAAFEEAVARRVGAVEGVATSSCTTALHLCLVVTGIGPGDEVVVPSLSFIATANVVRYTGAEPVFADVDEVTQNLTRETIEAVLTPRTKAVIVVHQAGMPADLDPVHALCRGRGIEVIEDAACAIGSEYKGRPIGGHSDLVAFSFHPRKVITTGEGGMVVTSKPEWAERMRRLREHGMSVSAAARHEMKGLVLEKYLETGFNYRMTDIQAAIGLVQLGKLEAIVARRRELAARYSVGLDRLVDIRLPADPPFGRTNHQSYLSVLNGSHVDRDDLLQHLMANGISPRRGIMASHLEPAYRGEQYPDLPTTERLSQESMILPMFHEMSESQQDRVIDALRDELDRRGSR